MLQTTPEEDEEEEIQELFLFSKLFFNTKPSKENNLPPFQTMKIT